MFLTDLDTRAIPPNLFRLLAPLVWENATYGRLKFPAGTVTDFASIPRVLRRHRVFDPNGPSRRPAVGHDYMYSRGTAPIVRGSDTGDYVVDRPVTRALADRFLYDALLSEGVSKPVAWMFYAGVRAGGWLPWRDYRRAEADKG